jgi:hypothetical protein
MNGELSAVAKIAIILLLLQGVVLTFAIIGIVPSPTLTKLEAHDAKVRHSEEVMRVICSHTAAMTKKDPSPCFDPRPLFRQGWIQEQNQ